MGLRGGLPRHIDALNDLKGGDAAFPHEPPVAPETVGMEAGRLAQARGLFPGGQLVVRRRGRVVASVAVGLPPV